jgi:hypothetical protein
MAISTVSFSRLQCGDRTLDANFILPAHKKRIESCLSSYSLKHPAQGGDLRVAVTQEPELKEVARILRYYRHMGFLPARFVKPQETELLKRTTKAAIKAMHEASVPGTNGQIIAGVRIAEDSLSVIRNILFASIGPNNPIASHLGYYAGTMWSFFSAREILGGLDDLNRAELIHDAEGHRRAQTRLASGALVATASASYLFGKVCDTLQLSPTAQAAAAAANLLFGAGSILAAGVAGVGWFRCRKFDHRLNEYLENPNVAELQKFVGALRFLKELVTVTPEEMATLRAKIKTEHPEWSKEEKEAYLRKEMICLTETKVKSLKRRTSVKALQLIRHRVDPLLEKLSQEKTRSQGIKETALFLQQIQNENRVKTSLHILSFIAASISVVALLVFTLLSAVVLSFSLYGIAGALYLGIEIYNTAGLLKRKDQKELDVDLHPMQDLLPLDGHLSLV